MKERNYEKEIMKMIKNFTKVAKMLGIISYNFDESNRTAEFNFDKSCGFGPAIFKDGQIQIAINDLNKFDDAAFAEARLTKMCNQIFAE